MNCMKKDLMNIVVYDRKECAPDIGSLAPTFQSNKNLADFIRIWATFEGRWASSFGFVPPKLAKAPNYFPLAVPTVCVI